MAFWVTKHRVNLEDCTVTVVQDLVEVDCLLTEVEKTTINTGDLLPVLETGTGTDERCQFSSEWVTVGLCDDGTGTGTGTGTTGPDPGTGPPAAPMPAFDLEPVYMITYTTYNLATCEVVDSWTEVMPSCRVNVACFTLSDVFGSDAGDNKEIPVAGMFVCLVPLELPVTVKDLSNVFNCEGNTGGGETTFTVPLRQLLTYFSITNPIPVTYDQTFGYFEFEQSSGFDSTTCLPTTTSDWYFFRVQASVVGSVNTCTLTVWFYFRINGMSVPDGFGGCTSYNVVSSNMDLENCWPDGTGTTLQPEFGSCLSNSAALYGPLTAQYGPTSYEHQFYPLSTIIFYSVFQLKELPDTPPVYGIPFTCGTSYSPGTTKTATLSVFANDDGSFNNFIGDHTLTYQDGYWLGSRTADLAGTPVRYYFVYYETSGPGFSMYQVNYPGTCTWDTISFSSNFLFNKKPSDGSDGADVTCSPYSFAQRSSGISPSDMQLLVEID